jgi:hypothetical protein
LFPLASQIDSMVSETEETEEYRSAVFMSRQPTEA